MIRNQYFALYVKYYAVQILVFSRAYLIAFWYFVRVPFRRSQRSNLYPSQEKLFSIVPRRILIQIMLLCVSGIFFEIVALKKFRFLYVYTMRKTCAGGFAAKCAECPTGNGSIASILQDMKANYITVYTAYACIY